MTAKPQTGRTTAATDKGGAARPANRSKVRAAANVQALKGRSSPSRRTPVAALRHRYHLSRKLFASMLGVTEATLAKWENGTTISTANLLKIQRSRGLLRKLEHSMRRTYIATWLNQPNEACADLGVKTPADLFAREDYETIEGMIFFLGSGVAF